MAIDSTAGGASSDSYSDVATADAYHATRLHNAEWAAATTADKEIALKWATRELDRKPWRGSPATTTQALRFPRTKLYSLDWVELDSTTIPAFLEDATAELAWSLLVEDTTVADDTGAFSSMSLDGVGSLAFKSSSSKTTFGIPVNTMISPYLVSGGGFLVSRV